MKRSLIAIGVVAVIATALLLPPYWFGTHAQKVFIERLETLAERSGLQKRVVDYHRGWFHSTADVTLSTPGNEVQFVTHHDIAHGPVVRSEEGFRFAGGRVQTAATVKLAISTLNGALDFTADTQVDLDGAMHTRLSSPPASTQLTNSTPLAWKGALGTIDIESKNRRTHVDLTMPEFTYGPMRAANVRWQTEFDTWGTQGGNGSGSIVFETIGIAVAQIDKFRIDYRSTVQNELMEFGLTYQFDKFGLLGQQYGPARLVLAFRNIDRAALIRFEKEANALRGAGRPTEQVALIQLGKLLQLAGELSRQAPELEVTELNLKLDKGDIRGKAKLTLDGRKLDIARNPLLIVTALAGDAELSMSSSVLTPLLLPLLRADLATYRARGQLAQDPTPEQEADILEQMMPTYMGRNDFTRRLVKDGDRYRLTASLRRGQVLVNGEPMNMSAASLLPRLQ